MTNGGPLESSKKSLLWEISILTAALLFVTRVLFSARGSFFVGDWLPLIVAILFLYAPAITMWARKRRLDFLDRNLAGYKRSFLTFIVSALIVFPAFLILAHYWQIMVFGKVAFKAAPFPNLIGTVFFQILIVSLPEEFFFRGYFQSAMDSIFSKRWRVLGVYLGWGWLVTALVFAFAHSAIYFKWWHFSIFFPALLFGYLRERTGTITAPVLFHAMSNVVMDWFARCYS